MSYNIMNLQYIYQNCISSGVHGRIYDLIQSLLLQWQLHLCVVHSALSNKTLVSKLVV
jgi:hypothetical protein